MGITKWYEIVGDGCGCAEHFRGSVASATAQARDNGWIVTRDGKFFCDEKRREKYRNEVNS